MTALIKSEAILLNDTLPDQVEETKISNLIHNYKDSEVNLKVSNYRYI